MNLSSKIYFVSICHIAFSMFPITAQAADEINVNQVLVNKLNAQKDKIQAYSPGAGYTFQSASYGGNFGATPVGYLYLKVEPENLTAASTFIGACFPANYSITANVTASTDVGYTFQSDTYLNTDTTLTADASYGGTVNVKLVANVQTGRSESSTSTTENLTANSSTASMSKNLKCPNYDQPQFFQAVGNVTKNVWKNYMNGSNLIPFYYYSFATKSGGQIMDADFQATFYKPGSITPGPSMGTIFYDKNNNVLAQYPEGTCQDNPNTCSHQIWSENDNQNFFTGKNYSKNATKFNISFGGNNANIAVRFQNRKLAWTQYYNTINQQVALPSGFSGDDLYSVELTNRDYTQTGAETRVVTIPVNKVLTTGASDGSPLKPDDQRYMVTGNFDSSSLNSTAMDVRYNMFSWDELNKQGGYSDLLDQCGGKTLTEAKKNWKNACGSSKSKSTQPLKLNLIKK